MGGTRRKNYNKSRSKRPRNLGKLKYDENGQQIDDRNTDEGRQMGYKDIVRENDAFLAYYKEQGICPPDQFDDMIKALQQDLPASFRVTGFRSQAKSLLNIIEGDYFKELTEFQQKGGKVVVPKCLDWYPDRMAYQLNVTRKDIRREEIYFRLHNFLVSETESGNTSRQETVSMIPPLVLDVKPHHKVLDMCAAPGSKTAQLIEALHQEEDTLPTGFVVANDADNSRCYMLTHQAKRLQSPCVLITNHDASIMPNLLVNKDGVGDEEIDLKPLKFDRILADVPCTGDGTMRKNPDIWPKWNSVNGPNLHGVQYRILKRGIELLEVGGRIVYSTCSLNPVEDEAVIHRLLKDADGCVGLVSISSCLPGLKYVPGLSKWILSDRDMTNIYRRWEDVPEKHQNTVRPQMFPPSEEDAPKYQLDRCIRVLPHLQNTGGFFVALLEKKAVCPWEKQERTGKHKLQEKEKENEAGGDDAEKGGEPPKKKQKMPRFIGYREDPYIYLKDDEPLFPPIKTYYDLDLPAGNFLTRCKDENKKNNLYFTTDRVKEIVEHNKDRVKIINTGVKAFTRCEHKGAECDFRIAQEGALMTLNFIKNRKLYPGKEDMAVMLENSDFDAPPENDQMSAGFKQQLDACSTGSVGLIYKGTDDNGDQVKVEVIGWKGKNSVRAYVPKNERVHYLRMVGGDTAKFEKNKFEEKKERQKRAESANGDENCTTEPVTESVTAGVESNDDDDTATDQDARSVKESSEELETLNIS